MLKHAWPLGRSRLAEQDEAREGGLIDPVLPGQDSQRREAPPAVAHVLQLLRPPVEAAAGGLPLRDPAGPES